MKPPSHISSRKTHMHMDVEGLNGWIYMIGMSIGEANVRYMMSSARLFKGSNRERMSANMICVNMCSVLRIWAGKMSLLNGFVCKNL